MKKHFLFASILLAGLLLLPASILVKRVCTATQMTAVLYVTPDGIVGSSCDSWQNACPIWEAIEKATPGMQIWVAQGIHRPTNNPDMRTAAITVGEGISLYGGFSIGDTALSDRSEDPNLTVLSGDIDDLEGGKDADLDGDGVVDIIGSNAYHVVVIPANITNATVIDGFAITGGNADGSGDNAKGGGIYIGSAAAPMLQNLYLVENQALWSGGGIHVEGGSPYMSNIHFHNNKATYGGGMYNAYGSAPMLVWGYFYGNRAGSDGNGYGGGMANDDHTQPTLKNVYFSNNQSAGNGGAMANLDGSIVTLTNVTFSNNQANELGAGLYNEYNVLTWNGGSIDTNLHIYTESGLLTLSNVIFRYR